MRPMDILKRAARPAPKASNAEGTAQTTIRPPQIPAQTPKPRIGEYAGLMKKHDRLKSRHVKQP